MSEEDDFPGNCVVNPNFKKETEEQLKHWGITCDGCKTWILKGNRWKCMKCPNYDLCDKCKDSDPPIHEHEFRKIKDSRREQPQVSRRE